MSYELGVMSWDFVLDTQHSAFSTFNLVKVHFQMS